MSAAVSTPLTQAAWYTIRATGVVALVLLTLTTVLGILTAGRVRARSWPAFAQADLHRRISLVALVFLAVHVLTSVVDTYVHVGWAAVLVPFTSTFRPLWTGLGTVAVDLLLAVAVSSALRRRIPASTWRALHWLAYGSWVAALVHTFGAGTDAARPWLEVTAGVCVVAVATALAWRVQDDRTSRELAARVGATTRAVPGRHLPGPGAAPGPATAGTATRLLERKGP